jgi:penicillin-binding protein 1C
MGVMDKHLARPKRRHLKIALLLILLGFCLKTYWDIAPAPQSLQQVLASSQILQVVDRGGAPLTISYQNRWNRYDVLPLHQMPETLVRAFVLSEDGRFYDHHGVDWSARMAALRQNIRARHVVRGASTITEQVARMLNPRPRTLWSKWLETLEASRLDAAFSKSTLLEFYLNQVPYAANRRGVLQAARYYFDRDLSSLTVKEMLALVVLVRAPSSFDLHKNPGKIDAAVGRLAARMLQAGWLDQAVWAELADVPLSLAWPESPPNVGAFVRYARQQAAQNHVFGATIKTTLDRYWQQQVQQILDQRVKDLADKNVHNAAAVVVDHQSGEILVWAVAGADDPLTPSGRVDAVTTPRQPGSALKPFLYGLALESGWSPATKIDDAPLATAVGRGLHHFKNYSNGYYGQVTLREALGNSLNIPALHTIGYVGAARYLDFLHELGFASLNRSADTYDEGLALGNGEVTLLELVTGYTTLANRGLYRPLTAVQGAQDVVPPKQLLSAEASSLIGHILSDPGARRLEFGRNSVLNLPQQTAVKTGTSTDYNDAWVVGFNDRYVVGIWMGNLDRSAMDGVTGSTGPALALRSMFAELNHNRDDSRPLFLSPKLQLQEVCVDDQNPACPVTRNEYFMTPTAAVSASATQGEGAPMPELVSPTNGLEMALDPRIPPERQQFRFAVSGVHPQDRIEWVVDDALVGTSTNGHYLWPLSRGQHQLYARVVRAGMIEPITLPAVGFTVK